MWFASSKTSSLYGKAYFDEHYQHDPQRELMYDIERRRLEAFCPGGRILDIGCGLGGLLDRFDRERWQLCGVEVSDYAAQIARGKGIFIRDYLYAYDYPLEFFDAVVFRGTIQHLDEPLRAIRKCVDLLKHGGVMAFLATPNTGSLCYRLFENLPALDPPRNLVLMSDVMLANILRNLGMSILDVQYPYWGTPYANPVSDVLSFARALVGNWRPFAWPGNMMELYARKP